MAAWTGWKDPTVLAHTHRAEQDNPNTPILSSALGRVSYGPHWGTVHAPWLDEDPRPKPAHTSLVWSLEHECWTDTADAGDELAELEQLGPVRGVLPGASKRHGTVKAVPWRILDARMRGVIKRRGRTGKAWIWAKGRPARETMAQVLAQTARASTVSFADLRVPAWLRADHWGLNKTELLLVAALVNVMESGWGGLADRQCAIARDTLQCSTRTIANALWGQTWKRKNGESVVRPGLVSRGFVEYVQLYKPGEAAGGAPSKLHFGLLRLGPAVLAPAMAASLSKRWTARAPRGSGWTRRRARRRVQQLRQHARLSRARSVGREWAGRCSASSVQQPAGDVVARPSSGTRDDLRPQPSGEALRDVREAGGDSSRSNQRIEPADEQQQLEHPAAELGAAGVVVDGEHDPREGTVDALGDVVVAAVGAARAGHRDQSTRAAAELVRLVVHVLGVLAGLGLGAATLRLAAWLVASLARVREAGELAGLELGDRFVASMRAAASAKGLELTRDRLAALEACRAMVSRGLIVQGSDEPTDAPNCSAGAAHDTTWTGGPKGPPVPSRCRGSGGGNAPPPMGSPPWVEARSRGPSSHADQASASSSHEPRSGEQGMPADVRGSGKGPPTARAPRLLVGSRRTLRNPADRAAVAEAEAQHGPEYADRLAELLAARET